MRLFALLMLFCAVFPAGGADELVLPLGAENIPGAWVEVIVKAEPRLQTLRPRLRVSAQQRVVFTCERSKRSFYAGAEVRFMVLMPAAIGELHFTLSDENDRQISDEILGQLTPAMAPTLLTAALTAPPSAGIFYEAFQTVIIPAALRQWTPSALEALRQWLLAGGQALCESEEFFQELTARRSVPKPQSLMVASEMPPALISFMGRGAAISLRGNAALAVLMKGLFPPRRRQKDHWQLAENRYQILGDFPAPDKIPFARLARWLGVWALLTGAALWLWRLSRSAERWPRGVVFSVLVSAAPTMVFLLLYLRLQPPLTPVIYAMELRDATAREFTASENFWLLAPPYSAQKLVLPFSGFPPPKLLAPNLRELNAAELTVTIDDLNETAPAGGCLTVNAELIHRGAPLIFSQKFWSPAAAAPNANFAPLADKPLTPAQTIGRSIGEKILRAEHAPPPPLREFIQWENFTATIYWQLPAAP